MCRQNMLRDGGGLEVTCVPRDIRMIECKGGALVGV